MQKQALPSGTAGQLPAATAKNDQLAGKAQTCGSRAAMNAGTPELSRGAADAWAGVLHEGIESRLPASVL